MDKSLEELEARLEGLVPRGLSDEGRERCSDLIERLAKGQGADGAVSGANTQSTLGISWKVASIAASIALGLGLGGGWWLGQDAGMPAVGQSSNDSLPASLAYDVLNSETWLSTNEAPNVYVTNEGEVREVFSEVAVTKDVVKCRESGQVITVETTDHHLVDSLKSEF
ncbi:hypothetical protein V2O64_01760 [Verrucomicrobiaceae bacterium 227]